MKEATPYSLQNLFRLTYCRGGSAEGWSTAAAQLFSAKSRPQFPDFIEQRDTHAEGHCREIKGFTHTSKGLHAPNWQLTFNEILWHQLCIRTGKDYVISNPWEAKNKPPPALAGISTVCILVFKEPGTHSPKRSHWAKENKEGQRWSQYCQHSYTPHVTEQLHYPPKKSLMLPLGINPFPMSNPGNPWPVLPFPV